LADVAQLAERVLGKDEVTSSILVIGSNLRSRLESIPRASRNARRRIGKPPEGWRQQRNGLVHRRSAKRATVD
jgi:hypothetical protein